MLLTKRRLTARVWRQQLKPGVQLLAFPVSVFFRFLMTSVFILMVLEVLRKSRFIANYRQQLAFGQPRNIQYIEQSWASPRLFHSRLVHLEVELLANRNYG